MDSISNWSVEAFKSLLLTIFFVIVLRASVVEVYRIPTATMSPTLVRGDYLVVNKLAYYFKVPFSGWFRDDPMVFGPWSKPRRGEVIAFYLERDPSRFFIKRVIGLPGDRISMEEGKLILNDQPIALLAIQRKDNPQLFSEMALLLEDRDPANVQIFEERLPDMDEPYLIFFDQRNQRFGEMMETIVPENHLFVLGDNRNELSDSRFFGTVPINFVTGRVSWVWLSYYNGPNGFRFRFDRIGKFIH